MTKSSLPISIEGESQTEVSGSSHSRPLFVRFVTWCMTGVWRTCVDWRTKRPFLTRVTAHVSIVALALIAVLFSGVGILAPRTAAGGSVNVNAAFPRRASSAEPGAEPTPTLPSPPSQSRPSAPDTVARLPVPHTTIPERVRTEIVKHTVEEGDTIFGIAAAFGLAPETIVWSNRETIKDAPWLIQPGIELLILPVDGVYHTTLAGETVEGIAADYDVDSEVLHNEWNGLEQGTQLREGQLLVVPSAKGEEVEWTPPPAQPTAGAAGYSYGVCSGVSYTGPGGNGWFVLPTGGTRVSGWYFHDPRNPTHIGLDYACRMGEPIYASDNGVVTIAGWNGGYGILIEVNHGNGFVTRYAHFSDIAVGCGQSVYQGSLLGYCGSTGWSSGAHLHFEVRHNGAPQDPQIYLP